MFKRPVKTWCCWWTCCSPSSCWTTWAPRTRSCRSFRGIYSMFSHCVCFSNNTGYYAQNAYSNKRLIRGYYCLNIYILYGNKLGNPYILLKFRRCITQVNVFLILGPNYIDKSMICITYTFMHSCIYVRKRKTG